jgi:hypothetical protein
MKKHLSLPVRVEVVHLPKQTSIVVRIDGPAIGDWCLGLCLLRQKLADCVAIDSAGGEYTVELRIAQSQGPNGKLRGALKAKNIKLTLDPVTVDYVLAFCLRYYRDGFAEVDHVDLEASIEDLGDQDAYVTLKFPDSAPPVSPAGARRQLGPSDVAGLVEQIAGKPCSRKEVGRGRSLSLGFGSEIRSAIKLNEKVYREWEIGTYCSAWRVVRGEIVLCGSQDVVDSIDELNLALGRIDLGRFVSLRQLAGRDVRIEFDTGIAVDFLATTSDEDECLHIFCPGQRLIQFSVRGGWKTGQANEPWANSGEDGT